MIEWRCKRCTNINIERQGANIFKVNMYKIGIQRFPNMQAAFFNINKLIGINIAYYRNLCNMSQTQLGDRLNISQSHVSKIERAAIGISMDMLCSIAKELEVEPYLLLKSKD